MKMYRVNAELEGHIFAFGRIGAGKSVSTKSIIEDYKENKKYKVFDMYGGERSEGLYWCIPNRDKEYWEKLEKEFGQFDESPKKQFRVNLLYPYFSSKFPKKLPKKPDFVNSKVFTIPLKDIEVKDIMMCLGLLSDTGKGAWDNLTPMLKKEDNAASLDYYAEKLKIKNSILYKNFIMPMVREKFLASKDCDYNIDLKQEANDLDVITVLCLDYVPEKYHLFILNYLLRKLVGLIDKGGIKKRNIIFIREASTFFRATEDSVLEDKFKIFRTEISQYIKMGRRGMYFVLDLQSPNECKGVVQGSEDFMLMYKTTSWRDKAEMTDELKRERRMSPAQVADLAFLEKGEVYIAETGNIVHKVKITLPRSDYWKKEYGNFYKSEWEKVGGEWKNFEAEKDYIVVKSDEVKEKYKDKLKALKKEPVKKSVIKQDEENDPMEELVKATENLSIIKPTRKLRPLPF